MNACYGVDFQAVCDAVNIGRVTASSASCILLVSAVPFAFMALNLIASSTTIGSLVLSCGVIVLTASALCQLYDYLPEAAGATGITLVNLVKKGEKTVERGLERLRESLDAMAIKTMTTTMLMRKRAKQCLPIRTILFELDTIRN